MKIARDPEAMASEQFDVVVVGGGIVGVCTLLEASRRGLKTLLIEADDYGGATSWNSLRIIHGGLRYLQNLDISRFRQSVEEQAWWMHHFPDLVEPLPCAMPLYNKGMRRTQVMRIALKLNDALASPIRRSILDNGKWDKSKILSHDETLAVFPQARTEKLKGAALWYDAKMRSPQRLIVELLRWSVAAGGNTLNYMRCVGFEKRGDRIAAVKATCGVSNREFLFETKHVINCGGPWWKNIAGLPNSENHATKCAVAFNVVVQKKPLSNMGLAVSAPTPNAPTYFIVPYGDDKMMVGTQHLPPQAESRPSEEQIAALLAEINLAIPDVDLQMHDVKQVLSGWLPPSAAGSAKSAKSAKITQGDASCGLLNLTSVETPKYTTARRVAADALLHAERRGLLDLERCSNIPRPKLSGVRTFRSETVSDELVRELQLWMKEESVVHLDDLLLRRCDIEDHAKQLTIGRELANRLPWPSSADDEMQRLVGAHLKHN